MEPKQHIRALLSYISEGIFEKEHIIAMALLCAIAKESIFLLGPPGTAKSLIARRLKMIFKDAKAFEYLMSRFSTPDEIFGPVSISKLKNEDKYERLVERYLPGADVVFLDEIWKAGSAIQNALLTAINERIYQNGSEILELPMKVLIAASNELPAEEEGLEALWDRFILRMVSNCISDEEKFYKMIRQTSYAPIAIPKNLLLTNELLDKWQKEILQIKISDEICQITTNIRNRLQEEMKKENINKMDYYISDRRWKKNFHLMRTSAFLNGRNNIHLTDLILLTHCLWNKVNAIPQILDIVMNSLTYSTMQRLSKIENALNKMNRENNAASSPKSSLISEEEETFETVNYFFYLLDGFTHADCRFSRLDYNNIIYEKDTDGILYHDSKGWIIHAIYTGAPFNYKIGYNAHVQKVKLRKCRGGIIVDGIPYAFKKKNILQNLQFNNIDENAFWTVIYQEYTNGMQDYHNLQETLSEENLFMSDDDRCLVNKQLSIVKKKLDILTVKIKNSKMLS